MSSDYLTFGHRFSRSVQCTMRILDKPPEPHSRVDVDIEWTRRLKRKHIPAYRQWVLSTQQILADRWQMRMLYALGVAHNLTELWGFEPGGAPRLVEKLNVGIP